MVFLALELDFLFKRGALWFVNMDMVFIYKYMYNYMYNYRSYNIVVVVVQLLSCVHIFAT